MKGCIWFLKGLTTRESHIINTHPILSQIQEAEGERNDKFPAGVTIGWCLQGMGFKSKLISETDKDKVGDIIKGMGPRYSTRNLNTNNTQRTISLRDSQSGQIVAVG